MAFKMLATLSELLELMLESNWLIEPVADEPVEDDPNFSLSCRSALAPCELVETEASCFSVALTAESSPAAMA